MRSLSGRTILITRQREQATEVAAEIEQRGGRAVVFPMIDITAPDSWDGCDGALTRLASYDALLFTSANGADMFLSRCAARNVDPALLAGKEVWAVGERTGKMLEHHGLRVSVIPERFSSTALAEQLKAREVRGRKFLYPRGNLGTHELEATLERQGATVDAVVVYRTLGADDAVGDELRRRLASREFDCVTFASPSAAENFIRLVSPAEVAAVREKTKVAVIGPTTRAAATKLGLPVDIEAQRSTVGGLVESIEEYFHNR